MRVACLVSGGKDSILAAQVVRDSGWELDSFLTLLPDAEAPMLFHKPNAQWVRLQAEAVGVPWLTERVVDDADESPALSRLFGRLQVDGIVTGALASEYQRTRFERVAHQHRLKTFSPLWHHDPTQHLRDVRGCGLKVRFVHTAADGLDARWLGRDLDEAATKDLEALSISHRINVAGEGGEYETFTQDAPLFSAKIDIQAGHPETSRDHGTYVIDEAALLSKGKS
ncbi:MAG TPA: diphthine--ammonia ligase [Candidatus Thermoplasmatota archaeon]